MHGQKGWSFKRTVVPAILASVLSPAQPLDPASKWGDGKWEGKQNQGYLLIYLYGCSFQQVTLDAKINLKNVHRKYKT